MLQRLCSAGITCQISVFVVFLMGNITDWRTAAGTNAALPLFTVLYILMVRREDAVRRTVLLTGRHNGAQRRHIRN